MRICWAVTRMINSFSPKQLRVLCWWHRGSPDSGHDAIICDGAVRSGKTFCLSLSFVLWSFYAFDSGDFGLCGKTIRSLRRNMVAPLLSLLRRIGFDCEEKLSQNLLLVRQGGSERRFYLFGGKDEGAAALIQGVTLSGVLFDEVALMPRSFVEQAIARCSVSGSRFWFNCNPEHPEHWFYREWIVAAAQKKALYLHFTMDDNPSLDEKVKRRYERLYAGVFYERFVRGRWVAAFGAVYPFMEREEMYTDPPDGMTAFAVSCDYGTVNPTSMGLWGKKDGVWYRVEEYYFDSRREGCQKTDEEHYAALEQLVGERKTECVAVDPSAASFIEVIRRHGRFKVIPAKNDVPDGIRKTSTALKEGKIRICKNCAAARREFQLYRWDTAHSREMPVKKNDHAMDDIRYFVSTVADGGSGVFVMAAQRG